MPRQKGRPRPRRMPVKDSPTDRQGTLTQVIHPYGVGIDTHSKFIQVCVLVDSGSGITRYEDEFPTTWEGLVRSHEWAMTRTKQGGYLEHAEKLRYTIESTGCYHLPVILAWQGVPSIVNPLLAGASRRKTDVLDARMLAHHSICGLWPPSFVPTKELQVLRVLLQQRFEATRNATRCSNRINNVALRFGHTLGRDHSLRDATARACMEDLCRGATPIHPDICPEGLPADVRPWFSSMYRQYDAFCVERDKFAKTSREYMIAQRWPTGFGTCDGKTLLRVLQSVPGVGEVTAMAWVAVIGDPKRFTCREQVSAYVGSDPSLKVSAGKVTSTVKRRGNARIHHLLKMVSAHLIRRHSERLGSWGYAIARRNQRGGTGRAVNAVARRLAIFLWQTHMHVTPFDYERYAFWKSPRVENVTLRQMSFSKRVHDKLHILGFRRSQEVADAIVGSLPQQKGIGAVCLREIKRWIEEHPLTDLQSGEPLGKGREKSSVKESRMPASSSGTVSKRRTTSTTSSTGTRKARSPLGKKSTSASTQGRGRGGTVSQRSTSRSKMAKPRTGRRSSK